MTTLREAGASERASRWWPHPLYGDGERWSSTSVRRALAEGDLDRRRCDARTALHAARRSRARRPARRDLGVSDGESRVVAQPGAARPRVSTPGRSRLDGTWWPAAISVGDPPAVLRRRRPPRRGPRRGLRGRPLRPDASTCSFWRACAVKATFADVGELTDQIGRDVEKTQ